MYNTRQSTNYVSDIDKLLQRFDKEHPLKSCSQLAEIYKYQRIYLLRDINELMPSSD